MRPTYDDFLHNTPAAVAFRKDNRPTRTLTTRDPVKKTATVDWSQIDFEAIANSIIRVVEKAGTTIEKAKTAVAELQALVAQRIQENPALTREVIVGRIFQADPELYSRVRQETTVDTHGRALKEIYDHAHVFGFEKSGESAADEVERRLDSILAKESRLTRAQAMQFAFRQDPELYAKWRRESYAGM